MLIYIEFIFLHYMWGNYYLLLLLNRVGKYNLFIIFRWLSSTASSPSGRLTQIYLSVLMCRRAIKPQAITRPIPFLIISEQWVGLVCDV